MWDEIFSEQGFAYGTEANDFLKQHFSAIPAGGKVLMLADGEGRNGVFMAKQGYNVLSVDSSKVGLQKAQELAKQQGVSIKTECVDLADYQPEAESFDAVISIFCHLPEPLQSQVLAMSNKVLKPQGYFLLESYRPKQLEYKTGGPPVAEMMMDLEKLNQFFAHYRVHHAKELDRAIKEGRLHDGLSAVVQVLLQKV